MRPLLVAVMICGLALTSCDRMPPHVEAASPGGPAGTPSPDPLTPPTDDFMVNPARPSPAIILGNSGKDPGLATLEWTFVALTNGGRRVVFRQPGNSPCQPVAGVVVTETADSVEISPKGPRLLHGVCAPVAVRADVRFANLAQPLGDRVLLHGPVG